MGVSEGGSGADAGVGRGLVAERGRGRYIGSLTPPSVRTGRSQVAKGQEKPGKSNKPKVTTKAKQAKKAEKKAAAS